eukprot:TRINITY_DN6798_c2_g2_i1.p1 TRINITY_DN6798_c2_g2~~TRINITY_DN6798_c2_g2_i1.p1  ORF type:complete len:262 (-),score=7.05 TRINITY_DN6798_c2_g2_i1:59-778(-)
MDGIEGALTRVVKFWSLTEGRDKMSKAVQYGCRLWIAVMTQRFQVDKASRVIVDVNRINSSVAQSRKVFRFGKSINFVPKVLQTLRAITSTADVSSDALNDRLLALVRDVGLAVYFAFDSLVWLSQIKVLRGPKTATLSLRARRAWCVGLVASILLHMRTYSRLIDQETQLQGKNDPDTREARKQIRARRNTSIRAIIKTAGDLQVAGAGVIPGYAPGPIRTALGGLTSACISCYELWK